MNVRDEDKTSSQEALKTQRQRVLDWLITDEGRGTLAPTNAPGYAGGLYENIKADLSPYVDGKSTDSVSNIFCL